MDMEAKNNSIQTDIDLGLIYTAINNLNIAKTAPHLIEILVSDYGLKVDEAKTVVSERVEHLKKVTPTRRLGQPEEVARAILFMASDESSWTTGHVVITDGGISALHP